MPMRTFSRLTKHKKSESCIPTECPLFDLNEIKLNIDENPFPAKTETSKTACVLPVAPEYITKPASGRRFAVFGCRARTKTESKQQACTFCTRSQQVTKEDAHTHTRFVSIDLTGQAFFGGEPLQKCTPNTNCTTITNNEKRTHSVACIHK